MKSFKDLVSPLKGAGQSGEVSGGGSTGPHAFPDTANPLTRFAHAATEQPYELLELQEGYHLDYPENASLSEFDTAEANDTFWDTQREYEEIWRQPQITPSAYSTRRKWPTMGSQPIETALMNTHPDAFQEILPTSAPFSYNALPSAFWSLPASVLSPSSPPLGSSTMEAAAWIEHFHQSTTPQGTPAVEANATRAAAAHSPVISSLWAEEFHKEEMNAPMDALATAYDESVRLNTAASTPFDQEEARQLAEFLRTMSDPKMDRSEFLHFVDTFASGKIKFGNKKLVDAQGEEVNWDAIFHEKMEAEQTQDEEQLSPSEWSVENAMRELEAVWDRAKENGEITEEEFKVFTSAFQGNASDDAIDSAWWEITEKPHLDTLESDLTREFLSTAENNPFKEMNSLLKIVKEFLSQGKVKDAMLACEAEILQNPESSEGWRLLGQMHADNEQDVEAIACLKRGHEVDPYNLDSLLALGVSLINELDSPEALKQLKLWIESHEDFQHIRGVGDATPENFSELTHMVTHLFKEALQFRPHNSDVLTALGVICNITKNYEEAVQHFSQAIFHGPPTSLPSLWNKIGATLANFGRSEAALLAYEQTLQLKPNYPRAWTNLGVAYANLGEMENALKYYLTALILNPKATHLWYYIRVAALNLGQQELIQYVNNQDIYGLKAHFSEKIINGPEDLAPAVAPSYGNFNSTISEIFNMLQ